MKTSACWLLVMLSSASALAATPAAELTSEFKETVQVCTNTHMYPTLASRSRDQGMPEKTAVELIEASMKKNFEGKLPAGMLPPLIDVVNDIYRRVYADPKLGPEGFDEVVFQACSIYRGYNIDKSALRKELGEYVQSAFDPFGRVTICEKAGQSAANFAQARDNGIAKEKMQSVAQNVLANDPRTLALAPSLIDDAYSLSSIKPTTFYIYNIKRCEAQKAGTALRPLSALSEAASACQSLGTKQEEAACLNQLFTASGTSK